MLHLVTAHSVVLALFTIGTTMLMIVTASNALRLRNVEISWKSGRLFGYPLFSSLFLTFSLIITVWVYTQQLYHYTIPMMCYNWIGLTWYISSYLMSMRFVTDHGIVKNINDPSQTVAWSRIMDYVERNSGKVQTYTFFYPDSHPGKRSRSIRLELDVPVEKQISFGNILQNKLGRRFRLGELENAGIEQLR